MQVPLSLDWKRRLAAILGRAAGPAVAAGTASAAATLAKGVLKAMFLKKMKAGLAIGLMAATLGMGAGFLIRPAEGVPPRTEPSAEERPLRKGFKSLMPDYDVAPPDLLYVSVLQALPGRPIDGERLIRPDGKISLGFYGELYVAGLTLPEIKKRLVLHLTKFLGDEVLGLVQLGR